MENGIVELLYQKEVAKAKNEAKERFTSSGGQDEVLRQFYLYAAHHLEKRFPTPHGLIFVDALRDLLKLYQGDEAAFLIDKAVEYLCAIDVVPFNSDLHAAAHGKSASSCLFDYLEGAIRIGDKAKSISVLSRFLSCEKNFKELLAGLMRIASSHETILGHTLILTNSALKGAKFLGASGAAQIMHHLTGYLVSRRPVAAEYYKGAELLDFKSPYTKVSRNIGLLGHHVIYLSHAQQAFEGAANGIIRENILNVMSRKFATKEPAADESFFSIPSAADCGQEELLGAIIRGDQSKAIGIVARLIERGEDSSTIFQRVVRGTCEKTPSDQSHYLIFANASLRAVDYLGPEAGRPFIIHAIKNACDIDYFLRQIWS